MDLDRKPNQGIDTVGSSSGAEPDPNTNSDWRSQVSLDTRQRMVNQIMDTMKKHLPVPAPEGSSEVEKIAIQFEEKIFDTATSEPDYVQKVSLKMLSMETKVQPGMNPPPSTPLGVGMTSQQPGLNPSQSLAMPQPMFQPPASRQQQQLQQSLLQDLPNLPSLVGGGPSGVTIPPVSRPSVNNHNPTSVPGETSGPGWSTGCLPIDMYSYTQRRQPPQQLMSQNQMLYQQQLVMHQNLQQQQQRTQMQMASALPGGSGMISAVPAGGMQQNQMNSVHKQPVGQACLVQHQPLMWQQQQQQLPSMQDPTVPMQQMNNVTELQQQQLQMLQNQMQQSQFQQNQLQQNQMQKSQMLSRQQNQLLGSARAGNMNNTQTQMQMQRQGLLQQQQAQQHQHLLSQFQLQQLQMPQQQLERPQQLSMMQQREMQMLQQGMQASPVLLQMQNSNDPLKQQQQQFIPQMQELLQQQRVLQGVASSPASTDSTAETGHPGDFQEEMFQRIKYLKDTYFNDLREIYQKLSMKLSHVDSIVPPNTRGGEQIERMKNFKIVLERMMAVLQLGKHSIHIGLKDKLSLYEKHILNILQHNKKAPQPQPQAEPTRRVKPRTCRVCGTCAHKRRDQ
ncbi:hypothetical protein LUZ63_011055 [Rhynchospora breviuscula]|uniref:Mediator complex subunit 15 KIX domain-containing protein n=1 Tax=Rhynchospora breviuscula TaxID=2022672 RepID=A0A9Q0CIM9_9POAL|nr:hypothetical protein LUZ63_011055 [Rhynchospora breviuscula]